jgi:hypothetical protein
VVASARPRAHRESCRHAPSRGDQHDIQQDQRRVHGDHSGDHDHYQADSDSRPPPTVPTAPNAVGWPLSVRGGRDADIASYPGPTGSARSTPTRRRRTRSTAPRPAHPAAAPQSPTTRSRHASPPPGSHARRRPNDAARACMSTGCPLAPPGRPTWRRWVGGHEDCAAGLGRTRLTLARGDAARELRVGPVLALRAPMNARDIEEELCADDAVG